MTTKEIFIQAFNQFKCNNRLTLTAYNMVLSALDELDSLHYAYNELNEQHEELLDIYENSKKIYVKDLFNGFVHEVGSNCHDSLILIDGGLFYHNLQNGDGTYKCGNYKFCDKTGNTEYNNDYSDNYYMIGFLHKGYEKQHQELKSQLLKDIIEKC